MVACKDLLDILIHTPCTSSSTIRCHNNLEFPPGFSTNGLCCQIKDLGFHSLLWIKTVFLPNPSLVSTTYTLIGTNAYINFP